jgi:hypothetical protein
MCTILGMAGLSLLLFMTWRLASTLYLEKPVNGLNQPEPSSILFWRDNRHATAQMTLYRRAAWRYRQP